MRLQPVLKDISFEIRRGTSYCLERHKENGPITIVEEPFGIVEWSKDSRQIFAMRDGRIVGYHNVSNIDRRTGYQSGGTYVVPRARGFGIGKLMWELMIEELNPRRIYTTVVSDGGLTLVTSLREKYPTIKFEVSHDGYRVLRDLRKRRSVHDHAAFAELARPF